MFPEPAAGHVLSNVLSRRGPDNERPDPGDRIAGTLDRPRAIRDGTLHPAAESVVLSLHWRSVGGKLRPCLLHERARFWRSWPDCFWRARASRRSSSPCSRSGTQLVDLFVTVTDRNGRLVPDLLREDFQVFDDGEPAEIVLFENDVRPITVVVMLDTSASMT